MRSKIQLTIGYRLSQPMIVEHREPLLITVMDPHHFMTRQAPPRQTLSKIIPDACIILSEVRATH